MKPEPTPRLTDVGGIRWTHEKLYEMEGQRIMIVVPRGEVRHIELRYGTKAQHPILQALMGIPLIGLGVLGLGTLLFSTKHEPREVEVLAGMAAFGLVGAWLVAGAFRRGYFLDVELAQGRRRLLFSGEATPEEMNALVAAVEGSWGLRGKATLR